MIGRTDLALKMIALADTGHFKAKELRQRAEAFDAAARGNFTDPPTHTIHNLMGAWGSARRLFVECGGVLTEETLGECARIRLRAYGSRR
jgi:hypothetical protein